MPGVDHSKSWHPNPKGPTSIPYIPKMRDLKHHVTSTSTLVQHPLTNGETVQGLECGRDMLTAGSQ